MYCTLSFHSPTWGPRRDRPAVWLSDRFPYNRATAMTMERKQRCRWGHRPELVFVCSFVSLNE